MKTLFTEAVVISMEEGTAPIQNGNMAIEDGIITYVGSALTVEEQDQYDEIVPCKGKAILPGFVNTHGHLAMTLLRGYADDLPLQQWLENEIWPMEGKMTAEHVTAGANLAVLEMIQGGTTTFLDMYDNMDAVANIVEQTGLRARLTRRCIGFGDDALRKSKLEEATSFAKRWNGAAGGRITTMMAPHSPYTCDPAFILHFVEKAAELGLPIHTHMSETKAEVELNVREYGARPVEHLDQLGFFDIPSLVAHAVHLTEEEVELLAKKNVKIAHNPGSNLKLGSGIAPITQMIAHGMRPSLATDGAASNNNLDLLEEIQLAALIHKGHLQDPLAVSAKTALAMGTLYGAEALFLDSEIGTLEVGKQADFITLDLTQAHMQPRTDVVSHIVYSATRSDVQDVFVQGIPLMKNREMLTIDSEKVIFEANQAFENLRG
ncbi:5-methylthioadenosine/S-adenosylhomocysteine deaminase [Thermoactinomyces sp. DSM 45891]|uniref:amidohydrolase n=2 Tax=Thermoactinomyces sp. DSM 45891 TaxID=1761907 RepID=UPI00092396D5|nr:amidohydrolase [Thermoactinomyces sp. DSM 45891]SFX83161.1 5-methylthioadenosine/S-adenosylhomocysteine deaminase [Thermoactinomyces sp. DSM 45891]